MKIDLNGGHVRCKSEFLKSKVCEKNKEGLSPPYFVVLLR